MSLIAKRILVACTLIVVLVIVCNLAVSAHEYFVWHRDDSFVKAASAGDIAGMRWYRLLGADVRRNASGCDPAIVAAGRSGNLVALKYLLDNGADINQQEVKFRWTALIAASSEGKIDAVRYLIGQNADLNATGEGGSALHLAKERGMGAVAAVLSEHNAKDYSDYMPRERKPNGAGSR